MPIACPQGGRFPCICWASSSFVMDIHSAIIDALSPGYVRVSMQRYRRLKLRTMGLPARKPSSSTDMGPLVALPVRHMHKDVILVQQQP